MRKRVERTMVTIIVAGSYFLGLSPLVMAEEIEPVAAPAIEEVRPEADLTIGLYSQYVWRGYALSNDSMVIQPSMIVSYKGFAFNLWGNLDTDNKIEDTNSWTETDMTFSYDWSMAGMDFGAGYIYYALEGDDSQEFYGSISKEFDFITPIFTVYRDTDSFAGWYMLLGLESSIPVSDTLAVDLGFSAGYLIVDDGQVDGGDYSDFLDGVLSVSMSFPVSQYISITPEMHYSFPLSSQADDLLTLANDTYSTDEDIIYGGISASFSF